MESVGKRSWGKVAGGILAIVSGVAILVLEIYALIQSSINGGYVWFTTIPITLMVAGAYMLRDGLKKRIPLGTVLSQQRASQQNKPPSRLNSLVITGIVLIIIGFFFFPLLIVGVIILVIGLLRKPKPSPMQVQLGGAISSQGTQDTSAQPSVTISSVLHKYCLSCGALIPPGMDHCPNCNAPVEDVYAVVHSPNMARGFRRGYAMLITSKRVVGSKWYKWQGIVYTRYYSYNLSPTAVVNLTAEEYEDAYKMAFRILRNPDFELDKDSIVQVVVKPKRFLRSGKIIFNTTSGESITVKTNHNDRSTILHIFVYAMKRLVGDRVIID